MNSSEQTVMVCLFNVWDATIVRRVLNGVGYEYQHAQFFYKPKKTFKHHQAPYISQVQTGAYFFKNEKMMKNVELGGALQGENVQLFIEQRRNLHTVETVPSIYDDQGQKVLECPQDPRYVRLYCLVIFSSLRIVGDFYHSVEKLLKPGCKAYLSGEGLGWGVLALLGKGIDMIITEPNEKHFNVLYERYDLLT